MSSEFQPKKNHPVAPEHTAERVSLWRALHTLLDGKPLIFNDAVGLKLLAPKEDWRKRPDMDPERSKRVRASIVARARFVEDLVEEQAKLGVQQYVIMGAGLDTFVQRRPEMLTKLQVFEVDQPGPQTWKRQRLEALGYKIPRSLHFVPVDFEVGQSWWEQLQTSGFDKNKPAIFVSTGVAMYLTREANLSTLRQMAKLAKGSTFAMTFMLPMELLEAEDQPAQEFTMKMARAAGTPFISFFSPQEMLQLAQEAGFKDSQVYTRDDVRKLYFVGRADGLWTASGEVILVAKT